MNQPAPTTQREILGQVERRMDGVETELKAATLALNTLAVEVRMDREARIRLDAQHEAVRSNQETRIAELERWRTATEATNLAAPRLTWGRFFGDTKTWFLAILGAAATVWGFKH